MSDAIDYCETCKTNVSCHINRTCLHQSFEKFDAAVNDAIKTDARLLELAQARRQRINEIIIEVGHSTAIKE